MFTEQHPVFLIISGVVKVESGLADKSILKNGTVDVHSGNCPWEYKKLLITIKLKMKTIFFQGTLVLKKDIFDFMK